MLIPECKDEDVTQVYCKCSCLSGVQYEPVGRWFEACIKRQRLKKSVSMVEEFSSKQDDDSNVEEILTDDEKTFMLSLDAKEWKKQDHYRVLKLSHMRWQATDEDVKKAYRKMVLKYHPDKKKTQKKANLPPGLNEHDYFTCIGKAYESLATIQDRQAYDSIDPSFDDAIPNYSPKQDFFKVFDHPFKINSRWSKKQPAPLLGDMNTPHADVVSFYSFWYDFTSWRTFSYQDEEEQGESREERRWIERDNRRARQKKKKEEIQRIRSLVDSAYQNDPRLKKFKEEEKQRKLQKKLAKEQAEKEKEQQRLQALEKERKLKEEAEQEAKEKALKEKKEKDKIKKAAARDRKVIRQAVKAQNFFNIDSDEISSLERLEKSLENLSIQSLQELRESAEGKDKESFKQLYTKHSKEILEKSNQQKQELKKQEEEAIAAASKLSSTQQSNTDATWSDEELKLLVKASQLFPVGTASRWEVIADYVNEHSSSNKLKTGKQVINKVKSLKKSDSSLKDEVNKKAFQNLEKVTTAKLNSKISSETTQSTATGKTTTLDSPADNPWSADEQKALELALKTYGSSTPERWEKISGAVRTRTKKECMKRYKELVEMVKAKKAAQMASK